MTVFTIADFKTQSAEEITAKFLSRDRMEHIGHFPILMEMYMDDRLTLTTEKIQQKQSQGKAYEQCCSTHSISPDSQKNTVLSHIKFPPSMESMSFSPGNQFLQGKKKSILGTKLRPFVNTGTFTLGMINFLNRYSALSTHPGRVHQENFIRLNMEISNTKALPYFNANAETTLQMDASKKGLRACLIWKVSRVTPRDPEYNIQLPIRTANMITTHTLMSIQPQDSFSKRKSTVQGNQLTRLGHYTSTGFPCDKKDLPTDLHESWNVRETLSIKFRMNITLSIICMIITQCLMSEHSSDSISNRLA